MKANFVIEDYEDNGNYFPLINWYYKIVRERKGYGALMDFQFPYPNWALILAIALQNRSLLPLSRLLMASVLCYISELNSIYWTKPR